MLVPPCRAFVDAAVAAAVAAAVVVVVVSVLRFFVFFFACLSVFSARFVSFFSFLCLGGRNVYSAV